MNGENIISGNVHYLEKVALLPGSELHVSLVDITEQGAWKTLATAVYSDLNEHFMDYELTFDPAKLRYGRIYSISANINYENTVVFSSTNHLPLDLSEATLWVKDVLVRIVSVFPNA
ncbi:YbaY family lipoprotein [Pseudomonas vancouverensis]|nr:YbaY family lipoprotein [Pseudomonas vancouverensis]SDU88897.1 Type III secretion system lipoprotein chaperone (YscW) [Pseudomonas vancouverensis]